MAQYFIDRFESIPLPPADDRKWRNGTLFKDAYNLDERLERTAQILLGGTLSGAINKGIDKVENHLPHLVLESGLMAGLGAATVAALIYEPQLATPVVQTVGVIGTVLMIEQVAERLSACAPSLQAAWDSQANEAAAYAEVENQLGDLAFESALGTIAGSTGGLAAYAALGDANSPPPPLGVDAHTASDAGSNATALPDIPVAARKMWLTAKTLLPAASAAGKAGGSLHPLRLPGERILPD